jgi:hypothetical protein
MTGTMLETQAVIKYMVEQKSDNLSEFTDLLSGAAKDAAIT